MSNKQQLADEDVVVDITDDLDFGGKARILSAIRSDVDERSFSFTCSAELKQWKFPKGWAQK